MFVGNQTMYVNAIINTKTVQRQITKLFAKDILTIRNNQVNKCKITLIDFKKPSITWQTRQKSKPNFSNLTMKIFYLEIQKILQKEKFKTQRQKIQHHFKSVISFIIFNFPENKLIVANYHLMKHMSLIKRLLNSLNLLKVSMRKRQLKRKTLLSQNQCDLILAVVFRKKHHHIFKNQRDIQVNPFYFKKSNLNKTNQSFILLYQNNFFHKNLSTLLEKKTINDNFQDKICQLRPPKINLDYPKSIPSKIIQNCSMINHFIGKKVQSYELLFRASQNNFLIQDFYKKVQKTCKIKDDYSNPLGYLFLIKSEFNHVFGAFTQLSLSDLNNEIGHQNLLKNVSQSQNQLNPQESKSKKKKKVCR